MKIGRISSKKTFLMAIDPYHFLADLGSYVGVTATLKSAYADFF